MEHGNWSASQQTQKHPHGGLRQAWESKGESLLGLCEHCRWRLVHAELLFHRFGARYSERLAATFAQPIGGSSNHSGWKEDWNKSNWDVCVHMLRFRFQCLWTSVWFIDEFKPDLWDLTRMSVSSSASKASLAAETEDNSCGSSPKHKAWRNTFCNKGAFLFYFFFKESALLGPKLSNAESSQNWTECTELLVCYNFYI